MKSLRDKFILSYILVILISFSIFIASFYLSAKRAVREDAYLKLENTAFEIESIIGEDIEVLDLKFFLSMRYYMNSRPDILNRSIFFDRYKEPVQIFSNVDKHKEYVSLANNIKDELIDKKTYITFEYDNNTYIALSYPIKVVPAVRNQIRWMVLFVPIEETQIGSPIIKSFGFALLVSIVAAIFIAIYLSIRIIRPIQKISSYARAIGRREFEKVQLLQTGDELEVLSKDIKNMSIKLMDYDQKQRDFFQNASHELKTPLMSIKGYAEGVLDDVFEDNEKALNIIVDESNRLYSLVQNLLYISKLENLEDYYDMKENDLIRTLKESVEKVKSLADERMIQFKIQSNKPSFRFVYDKEKMTQTFINILANAIRYASSIITIDILVKNGRCTFIFSDDGEGFDEDEEKIVFERLYRGKKGNHGLGLAIAKTIIEKHNGDISACNGLKGAKIIVTF